MNDEVSFFVVLVAMSLIFRNIAANLLRLTSSERAFFAFSCVICYSILVTIEVPRKMSTMGAPLLGRSLDDRNTLEHFTEVGFSSERVY